MPDFSKGKIYKVFSPSTNLEYIGSTIKTLNERFSRHRREMRCSSKIIFEVGDAKIILLHNFPCDSLDELETEEGRVQDLYPDKVNINRAGRTLEGKRLFKNQMETEKRNKLTQEERAAINKKARDKRSNMTQEERDEFNKYLREKASKKTEDERAAKNKHRRELRAKKKEAAKTNSLDVSN